MEQESMPKTVPGAGTGKGRGGIPPPHPTALCRGHWAGQGKS